MNNKVIRIGLFSLAFLILNGCSSVSNIVPQFNNPSAPAGIDIEQANAFLKAGKRRDAASAYFAASNNYKSPQRERLILQAAELASLLKDSNLTQRYLAPVASATSYKKLNLENQMRFRLVQGQLALNDKNFREVLRILPQRVGGLPTGLADKVLKVRMDAVQASGDRLSLIQELVLQEPRLKNDYETKLNHDRIWANIQKMPTQKINEGRVKINHLELKRWFELGLLARSSRASNRDELNFQEDIRGWIKRNPKHPGITKTKKLLVAKPAAVVTPYLGGVKPAKP